MNDDDRMQMEINAFPLFFLLIAFPHYFRRRSAYIHTHIHLYNPNIIIMISVVQHLLLVCQIYCLLAFSFQQQYDDKLVLLLLLLQLLRLLLYISIANIQAFDHFFQLGNPRVLQDTLKYYRQHSRMITRNSYQNHCLSQDHGL